MISFDLGGGEQRSDEDFFRCFPMFKANHNVKPDLWLLQFPVQKVNLNSAELFLRVVFL